MSEYGRAFYEAAYAGTLWNIYQVLGKLCPAVHCLKKPGSQEGAARPAGALNVAFT